VFQAKNVFRDTENVLIDKGMGLPKIAAGLKLPKGVKGFNRAKSQEKKESTKGD
jgi:hypothetical protein